MTSLAQPAHLERLRNLVHLSVSVYRIHLLVEVQVSPEIPACCWGAGISQQIRKL